MEVATINNHVPLDVVPINNGKYSVNKIDARCSGKMHYFYELAGSKSSGEDNCDTSSKYGSINEIETDTVRDTDDTFSMPSSDEIISNGVRVVEEIIEYEVMSSDVLEYFTDNSSSGTDDHIISFNERKIVYLSSSSSESDSESLSSGSIDPELSKSDYWQCFKCHNKHNNPMCTLCEKCYQKRKNFYPPHSRPLSKRRKRKQTSDTDSTTTDLESDFDDAVKSTKKRKIDTESNGKIVLSEEACPDSGVVTSNSQASLLNEEENVKNMFMTRYLTDCEKLKSNSRGRLRKKKRTKKQLNEIYSTSSNLSENTVTSVSNSQESVIASKKSVDTFGLCNMCCSEPKNGVFIHSKCVHCFTCYKCAMKIWNTRKNCPICNRKITNVMKLFMR